MRPTYVSASGTVIRRGGPEFYPIRLFFAIFMLLVLYATNPANKFLRNESEGFGSQQDVDGSWLFTSLGSVLRTLDSFSSISSSRISATETNYVLFSLQNDVNGVYVGSLMNQYCLCHYFGRFEIFCGWIGDNLCHGMKVFDPQNRPFTAHRMLAALLIIQMILSACAKYGWRGPAASIHSSPFATPLSIFSSPSIVEDLFSLNVMVYPALVAINRIVSLGSYNASAASMHFYGSTCALVFGIGGLSNLAASALTGHGEGGLNGVTSAALGYLIAISPSKVIVTYLGTSLYASDILFGMTVLGMINLFVGYAPFVGRWSRGSLFAWIAGGMGGNMMAQYQLNRYGLSWFPFRRAI